MNLLELELALPRAEVLHFMGYPDGAAPAPGVAALLEDSIEEARALAHARGAWLELPVDEALTVGLEPMPARSLIVGLVTAGAGIEDAASRAMRRGAATAALVLDACGSAAAEEAADRLSAAIVAHLAGAPLDEAAPSQATPVSCRISPGYGQWPLEGQRALFSRLPHEALGIRLESSLLMVPRKSISFAMWLGAEARPLAGLSGCARCRLESCLYRRQPMNEG